MMRKKEYEMKYTYQAQAAFTLAHTEPHCIKSRVANHRLVWETESKGFETEDSLREIPNLMFWN